MPPAGRTRGEGAAPRLDQVEAVAAEALRPADFPLVTASAVYAFAQSPFAAWCDAFAPESERDPADEFRKLLLDQGRRHEASVLARRCPDAQPVRYETEEEGFRLMLRAMAEGEPHVLGAPVFYLPEGLKGRVDLLERRDDAPSRWGDYHYVVKEIKLAKNVRDHHRLQGAFYNHVLGKLQGFTPQTFAIVNRDHEETTYAYDESELLATLRAIRAIQRGEKPPAIHGAGLWPWESYTDRCAAECRDVSLVGGVGPAWRDRLVRAGFATVDHLAGAHLPSLVAIKGIGDKTARRLQVNAQAIVAKRHIPLAHVAFEPARTEIFLDLEGTGAQTSAEGLVELDYLIGVLVRRDGKEEYRPFVAKGLDGEREMFHDFVAWLATQRDHAIYHWHNYEATHLKRLAERHGLEDGARAHLFPRLRDLHKDATAAFAFPTPSTSIKAIAPYAGFQWRHKDVNAMASIALYFEWAQDPSANSDKLQKILDYNEDDCIAMRVVKDWLVAEED